MSWGFDSSTFLRRLTCRTLCDQLSYMPYKDLEQQREYQRRWSAKRRRAFFEGKTCAHCGTDGNLQLDHVDPSDKTCHKIWTWSKERRDQELAKCQALCSSCHTAKTLAQRRKTEHGTLQMYQAHGCRCDLCKAKKLASSRHYRRLRET